MKKRAGDMKRRNKENSKKKVINGHNKKKMKKKGSGIRIACCRFSPLLAVRVRTWRDGSYTDWSWLVWGWVVCSWRCWYVSWIWMLPFRHNSHTHRLGQQDKRGLSKPLTLSRGWVVHHTPAGSLEPWAWLLRQQIIIHSEGFLSVTYLGDDWICLETDVTFGDSVHLLWTLFSQW